MPTLAGWLTGEQVPKEIIEQTLTTMGTILGQHGGNPARIVQPGFGLITFSEPAYATREKIDAPVLDWVPDRRTFVYRRPLSGTHVLYYVVDWPAQGNLLFASEIKALLALGVARRLHLAALDALLRYGFIPAPWTAFQDISVVPAGSNLRWQKAKTLVNSATDYSFDQPPLHPTAADTLDALHSLLDKTTAAILPPHAQLVALTGGGLASALVTSLTALHTSTPFTVATIGYKKNMTGRPWAEAERLASTYHCPFLAITGIDAPEFWTAAIVALEAPAIDSMPLALHQLLHTTSIETGARVAINGLGAHTIFGTKLSQSIEPIQGQQDTLQWYEQSLPIRRGMSTPQLWSNDAAHLISQQESWEQTLHARKLARRAAQFPTAWQQQYYLDLHLRLPDLVVGIAEQLATLERIALRSPYLAPDVMDMLTRLPAVLQDGTRKEILLSDLAQKFMPGHWRQANLTSPTGDHKGPPHHSPPPSPLRAPTASLLRVADSELLQQMLSQEALQATGIFDPEAVQELLMQKILEGGMAPRELLLVFTTQLLCRMFGVGID